MIFGDVITAIKQGDKATRQDWKGFGLWIELYFADEDFDPFITLCFQEGDRIRKVAWPISSCDILADDWVVFK